MTGVARRNLAAALLAGATLLGCSSGDAPNDLSQLGGAVRGMFKSGQDATASTGVSAAQVAQSLAATTDPLALVGIEDRKTQTLVLQIEQNGPYRTFATSTRQTVTMRRGMVTATRGLGGDLMSSDEDALLALVSNRRAGTVPYTMRFLTGDEKTVALTATCEVALAGTGPVQGGEVNTTAQIVTAICGDGDTRFTNAFLVDKTGTILSTRQWLGPLVGYFTGQTLRR